MKSVLTAIFVMASLFGGSQTINGFGNIRIGKTYAQTLSDLGITKTEVVTNGAKKYASFDKRKVTLLKLDTTRESTYNDYVYIPDCPESTVLLLPLVKVAGISVENVRLSFFRDTLFSINVDDPSKEFIEAFKIKNGEGALKKEEKEVRCSSLYVKNYSLKELTHTTSWSKPDDSLQVFYVVRDYRNDKCEQRYLVLFSIGMQETARIEAGCSVEYRNRLENKRKEELKKKLDGF